MMDEVYFAVNYNGTEICSNLPLFKRIDYWSTISEEDTDAMTAFSPCGDYDDVIVQLPKGTIEKIIGKSITWYDGAIKMKI